MEELSQLFQVDATAIQWLATGYFLTLGILVPVTGILMQKFTTRQMFIPSLVLSIIGTVLAAVAPVFSILLTARVIQAAGLAIILPLTQNVIFTIFPANKRGGAMGFMGLVILAGMILDLLSWHWIFWFTVPFLLFSFIFGYIYMPNVNEIQQISIDSLSVILSTIGFGGVVYGVSIGGELGWTNVTVITTVIVGFIALLLFAIRQLKMDRPMLNLTAFKYPLFVLGLVMNMITFFNMLAMLVVLPMYMQIALLLSAFVTGLIMLPGNLLNCILAPTIGKLFDKYGPRAVITPGTILVACGYGLYAMYGTETALWMLVMTHIIMMLGVGMVLASVQTNTLNALPRQYYPDGIPITQTSQQVSGAIGIAVMVSLFSAQQNSYLSNVTNDIQGAAATGSSFVFKISFVLALVNVVLSLFMKKTQ